MVEKKFKLDKNILVVEYVMKPEYTATMLYIHANHDKAEFEQRSIKKPHDIDGFEMHWKDCDALVEMGLLYEDEEQYNVVFHLTEMGKDLLALLIKK